MGRTLMLRQMDGENYTTMDFNPFLASILLEINKRILVWVGLAWRKHDSLIRKIIEENSSADHV